MVDYTAVAAQFQQYRLVSMGVRVYPIMAPTSQSGTMRAITSPSKTVNGDDLAGGFWDSVINVPVSDADVHFIAKPKGTTWKQYDTLATEASFNTFTVLIKGAAVSLTNGFTVEVVMNMECLVKIGTIVSSIATPGEDSSPATLQAAAKVHGKHTGVHTGGQPSMFRTLGNFAKEALLDVAANAIPFVGRSVAGLFRSPRRPQTIMDVD